MNGHSIHWLARVSKSEESNRHLERAPIFYSDYVPLAVKRGVISSDLLAMRAVTVTDRHSSLFALAT